jgi:ribosomal RNA assembly protein
MQYVRIPGERVSALIGKGGATKKRIEERTKCRITVAEGEVSVEGQALDEWVGKDVVHAIGRGFNPDKALMLLKDGYVLDFIELKDYANTPKSMERLRGRVIGENGRTRRFIERNTGAMLCVYGKTIALIGAADAVALAKDALSMLLSGSKHATVYHLIDRNTIGKS